jgi:hypothetical protein
MDMLLVSETHFMEHNNVYIPNLVTYATNHPGTSTQAGSAIFIRKDIKHHELAKYEVDHIQATNISIEDWDENLTILAILLLPTPHNTFINSLG